MTRSKMEVNEETGEYSIKGTIPNPTTAWEGIDTVGKLKAALEDLITVTGEDCKLRWAIVTSLFPEGYPETAEEVECVLDIVLDNDKDSSVLLAISSTEEDEAAAAVYYDDLEELGF